MGPKINNVKSVDASDEENKIKGLLKKSLRVFRVSPLYNFEKGEIKSYEKKLNEEVNRKNRTSLATRTKFILIDNLRQDKRGPEGILVEITTDDGHLIYSGHFLSWSPSKEVTDGSVSLPILLVEGKKNEIDNIHSSLGKIFDCDIQPSKFSFFALLIFFVKLLETPRSHCDVSKDHITLEYTLPHCDARDRIKVGLSLEDTTVAYAIIKKEIEEKPQEMTDKQIIHEFYYKVLNHLYHVYRMDFTLAGLQKISFSDASMSSDGQIKVITEEAVENTLYVVEKFAPLDAILNI